MPWLVAMMVASVLLGLTGNLKQKGLAWGSMFFAWLFGMLAITAWGFYPPPVIAFMFIDGLAARIVLSRPRSLGQQLVGLGFIMMLAWHIGFYFTDMSGVKLYLEVQLYIGWIQWGVLMAWGGIDAGKAFGVWPWRNRAMVAGKNDIGAGGR
jgi:hypothetical protein